MHILAEPRLEHFRRECRDWLARHVPRQSRPPEGAAMREFDLAWQRCQYDGGWAGLAWPAEFGGRGATLLEQLIWYEEYARAEAPPAGSMFVALSHAGPTLMTAGTAGQKSLHLPKILRGEAVWCQGFSEPSAGSDLASLRCRAEIDADHLIVNGTKIWTTYGHLADFQELLVRTDPAAPRHKGISWVICDMRSPGIEIRPIKAMSGLTHFAQVFYDNVRIPIANLVGELHAGWRVAMTTLGFERGTGMMAHQLELSATVDRLVAIARATPAYRAPHRRLMDDEMTAATLAQLRAEVAALRSLTIASISRALREPVPGPEGNIVALYFGELTRRVYQAALDLLGPTALERSGENWPLHYFEAFKWAIGGGTSEMRRNAVGERVLGLPKEQR